MGAHLVSDIIHHSRMRRACGLRAGVARDRSWCWFYLHHDVAQVNGFQRSLPIHHVLNGDSAACIDGALEAAVIVLRRGIPY
ncbi:MAG: hypothetical protein HC945_02530 [Nitrosarchaeum sp.]|nr:hypothetical protein [Nitrosarchaeum sp.]